MPFLSFFRRRWGTAQQRCELFQLVMDYANAYAESCIAMGVTFKDGRPVYAPDSANPGFAKYDPLPKSCELYGKICDELL